MKTRKRLSESKMENEAKLENNLPTIKLGKLKYFRQKKKEGKCYGFDSLYSKISPLSSIASGQDYWTIHLLLSISQISSLIFYL